MFDLKSKAREVIEHGYCVLESVYDDRERERMHAIFKQLCDDRERLFVRAADHRFSPALGVGT